MPATASSAMAAAASAASWARAISLTGISAVCLASFTSSFRNSGIFGSSESIALSSAADITLPPVTSRTRSPRSPMDSRISSMVSLPAVLFCDAADWGTLNVRSAPLAATAFSWSSLDCSIAWSRAASSSSSAVLGPTPETISRILRTISSCICSGDTSS